jgi:hypothetical protein
LLEALRASREEALASLRAIDPADLERGRYESGWNGRQILAHIASIEWTYPRLIETAKGDPPAPRPDDRPAPSAQVPYQPAQGSAPVNEYNERQVAKRADTSIADLLAEFETNREATIEAVEAAQEELFAKPVRSGGGLYGPLAAVLWGIAVEHVRGHLRDIAGEG